MPAITWQNVQAPSLAQASGPLMAAQQGFSTAMGQLTDALKERETIANKNWDVEKSNNTNAFLDAVSKYTDPDKLKAAQSDPNSDLNQLRAKFGTQVDMDKVRGAADARMAQTMQQAQDQVAFHNVMRNEKTAPLVDQLRSAILTKDSAAEQAARAGLTEAGYRDFATQDKFAHDYHRQLVGEDQSDKTFTLNQDTGRAQITHMRTQDQIGQGQLEVARSNASTNAQQVHQQGQFQNWQMQTSDAATQAAKQAAKVGQFRKELADSGNLYAKEGVWDGSQSGDFMDLLTKNKIGDDPGERSAIISRISKIAKDGITIKTPDGKSSMTVHDLPVSAIRTAIMGSTDNMFNMWNQGYANSMEDNLKNILQSESLKQDSSGKSVLSNKMTKDLESFRSVLQDATANAQPLRPVIPSTQMPGSRRK